VLAHLSPPHVSVLPNTWDSHCQPLVVENYVCVCVSHLAVVGSLKRDHLAVGVA
jgi:hypothetical protein